MAMEPDEPDEEFVDNVGVHAQIFLKIEYTAVIERGHDAHGVKALGVAEVGVNDVWIAEHSLRTDGGALQQVVEVSIHTGYHVASESVAQLVHHGCLLAAVEACPAGQHHLYLCVVIFKVAQHTPPEEDVVIRLHVCHHLLLLALGSQAVGCLYVGGVDIG